LNNPTGIALDSTGTYIYFADTGSNRIRRIAAGQITTVAGCIYTKASASAALAQNCTFTSDGLPATVLTLNLSSGTAQNTKKYNGVAVDKNGVIYFSESGSQVVRKVQLDGTVATIAGQAGTALSGGDGGPASDMFLDSPEGVAVDNNGYIFIADTTNLMVHQIAPSGIVYPFAGQSASNSDAETANDAGGVPAEAYNIRFRAIQAVTVDYNGNAFVADTSNNKIDRIPYAAPAACTDKNGNLVPTGWPLATAIPAACTATNLPGVEYRVAGNEGNTADDFMYDYTAPASATAVASTVQVSFPMGMGIDPKGNLIFADCANNLIRIAVCPKGQVGCQN